MKQNHLTRVLLAALTTVTLWGADTSAMPQSITVKGIALNPEGIEYDRTDHTFLLSSLNAAPIIKVKADGTWKPFTHGEKFPLSTAGLQIDYARNRLLVAGFNGTELMDNNPATKGTSRLRIYDLTTGALKNDVELSTLAPKASAYFANDIAVDKEGNAYVSDWYARVIYKVTPEGKASLFWRNETGIASGPNGLDFHPDGYLLVSILTVNDKGLYANYGLVNIPLSNPKAAKIVTIKDKRYTGFDGMVLTENGTVVGVTNDQKTPGGNTLITLSGSHDWQSATVTHAKAIPASTTVAVTPKNGYYVINQDFTNNNKKEWTIQQVDF